MDVTMRLEEVRLSRGFTVEELSRKAGVRRTTVRSIERGSYMPTVELAGKLCRALNATLDEVFA